MKSSEKKETVKYRTGRPQKFAEPSRPVTMTLPERTLRLLAEVDADRAKAVVKATDAVMNEAWPDKRRVRLATIDEGSAVIVVGPSATLKRIPWLRLVEIAPARYLLAIPTGTAPERLEVAISDLIEDSPEDEADEHSVLEDLRKQIGHLRREDKMSKVEIIIVEA